MTTRLDVAIQKHPEHEAAIRSFAERDPSGNLKYLHWQIKVLASGQALAPEISDVVDLFHKFNGQWYPQGRRRERQLVRRDLYSYRPQDLASLRDALLKLKRASDKKRRERERLYRIDGAIEADVVYESDDLIVRHIKNKQASVHYGLGTRWCISMNQEEYFSDYETQNATFFFFERKTAIGDNFDKCALMIGRGTGSEIEGASCFDATDERVEFLGLVKVYGTHVFDILRVVYERSEAYPGSAMACVLAGTATAEQLDQAYALVQKHEVRDVSGFIEAVCCNDAAPLSLLERVSKEAAKLLKASWKRQDRAPRYRHRRRRWKGTSSMNALSRTVLAALSIHPNVPIEMRETIAKRLRKAHVNTDSIHIERSHGPICVVFRMRGEPALGRRRARYRRRRFTVSELTRRVGMYERMVQRTKKKLRKAKQEKRKQEAKREQRANTKKPRTRTKSRARRAR